MTLRLNASVAVSNEVFKFVQFYETLSSIALRAPKIIMEIDCVRVVWLGNSYNVHKKNDLGLAEVGKIHKMSELKKNSSKIWTYKRLLSFDTLNDPVVAFVIQNKSKINVFELILFCM